MADTRSGCPPADKARFLEQIADTMREIIWISDAGGETLCYINPAFERVVGRRTDELYQNPGTWHDCVHPDDRDRIDVFRPMDVPNDSTEFRILRPNNEVRWLWLHRASVRGNGGGKVGIVGVVEDITERKRAELALRESVSLLRATLESTADGILVVDLEGRVTGFNRQFLDLWKIPDFVAQRGSDNEIISYILDQLADPLGFERRVRQLYGAPEGESFDVLIFRDGRVIEWYSRPQRLESEIVGRVWSFRDVTAQRRAEEALLRRNRRLDIQTQVLLDLARRRLRHGSDMHAVLPEITEAGAVMLDTERVSVWMLDEAHTKIRMIDLYERSRNLHSGGAELLRATHPSYFKALELERTVAADDARSDPRTREFTDGYLKPNGITSMLDAPIRNNDGLCGVVCFEHVGARRHWTAEDRTFAGSVADLLSVSIEAAELQRAEDGVRLLLDASTVLASSLDYRTTLTNVARLAVPTLADWCIVSVIEDGEIKRVAIAHVDPEKEQLIGELEQRYPEARSSTPAVHVIRTGEAELVPEVTEQLMQTRTPDDGHRALMEKLGLRSYMSVPLVARGATLGAITFASVDRLHDAHDLALAKDIATRSATAIDNAQLHAKVVEANRAKSSFLSVMSHELRTPLSAITGYACLLAEGIPDPATPRQAEHLDRIRANAAELLRVIDEILEFSRLETGEERLHVQTVELAKLLAEVAGRGEGMARERGLHFRVHADVGDQCIRTDPDKLRHILLNLISNSVKFTREGGVDLHAGVAQGVATFQVRDTGIGIPEELLDKVFEPFFQVGDPLTREVGGTGIGLAVVRGLSRQLGGDVEVASRQGEGTTFTVTIPDRLDARDTPSTDTNPGASESTRAGTS